MLGGNFWVSFFRNGIGAGLMLAVFLMLDRPKVAMKKAILCHTVFGFMVVTLFSVWYLSKPDIFVRFSGLLAFVVIGIYCMLLSGDGVYLALYKISLAFYLLSMCVFLGVDIARWLFNDNMWIDLLVRCLFLSGVIVLIARYFRKYFFENVDFLREEIDMLSVATLIISFIIAAFVAYLPSNRVFSMYGMLRMLAIMLMVGLIQYLILHLYIHLGKEHCYQAEKQLLEMNEQLLKRQLELERKAQEEMARIRHDMRHHYLMICEYLKNSDSESLFAYLKQYQDEVDSTEPKRISANKSVNGILSAYAGYAEKEDILVKMNVSVAERLAIRDIDLVAILANILENAIQGCIQSRKEQQEIRIDITQKGHKIVIQCRNSSADNIRFHKGLPQSVRGGGIGTSSIVKTASRYDGETDFQVENGMFLVRVLLNLPT